MTVPPFQSSPVQRGGEEAEGERGRGARAKPLNPAAANGYLARSRSLLPPLRCAARAPHPSLSRIAVRRRQEVGRGGQGGGRRHGVAAGHRDVVRRGRGRRQRR